MTVPDNRFLAETGSGGDKEVGPFAAFQVADMYEHYLLVMSKDRNGRDPCPCWVCIGCPGALCAQVMNVLCVRFEMQECGGVLQHAEERGKQRAICCVYWGHACNCMCGLQEKGAGVNCAVGLFESHASPCILYYMHTKQRCGVSASDCCLLQWDCVCSWKVCSWEQICPANACLMRMQVCNVRERSTCFRGLLRALQGIVVFGNPLCALLFKTGVC
eukprot:1141646-Pelagomonas_calceolata.AAC.3